MSRHRWYNLAEVVEDHPGWAIERERIEAALRSCVARAGEEYDHVVFAPWTIRADGSRVHVYLTSSRAVWERFGLPDLFAGGGTF